jgi:antitoxin component of MazEF toxin-antitoxin module
MSGIARLTRNGNSTTLTLSPDVLEAAGMARGDQVLVSAKDGVITITRADSDHAEAIAHGRAFMARYDRMLAHLAR